MPLIAEEPKQACPAGAPWAAACPCSRRAEACRHRTRPGPCSRNSRAWKFGLVQAPIPLLDLPEHPASGRSGWPGSCTSCPRTRGHTDRNSRSPGSRRSWTGFAPLSLQAASISLPPAFLVGMPQGPTPSVIVGLAEDPLPLVGIHIRVEAFALIGAVEIDGQDAGPAAVGRRGGARFQGAAVLDDDVLRPEIDLAAFRRRLSEFQRAVRADDVDVAEDIGPGAYRSNRACRSSGPAGCSCPPLVRLSSDVGADLAVAGAGLRPGDAACEHRGRQAEQESCQQAYMTRFVPNRDELHAGTPCHIISPNCHYFASWEFRRATLPDAQGPVRQPMVLDFSCFIKADRARTGQPAGRLAPIPRSGERRAPEPAAAPSLTSPRGEPLRESGNSRSCWSGDSRSGTRLSNGRVRWRC